jgi:hypothetical protein
MDAAGWCYPMATFVWDSAKPEKQNPVAEGCELSVCFHVVEDVTNWRLRKLVSTSDANAPKSEAKSATIQVAPVIRNVNANSDQFRCVLGYELARAHNPTCLGLSSAPASCGNIDRNVRPHGRGTAVPSRPAFGREPLLKDRDKWAFHTTSSIRVDLLRGGS